MNKNKISGRVLKVLATAAIIVLFIIFAKENAYAASFGHVHTDECYETVTKQCTSHYIRDETKSNSYHCNRCNAWRNFKEIVYWDICGQGLRANRDVAYRQYCTTCGYARCEEMPGAPDTHAYTTRDVVCGMTESTSIADISLSPVSNAPTNGNVTLSIGVSGTTSEFALADAPYDFGAGFTSNPSMEVTENGTYSATVKDSRGRTVSVSFTVDCIDRDLPVIESVSKNTEDWSEDGVILTVTAHDDKAGLHGEAYSFNGGAFTSSNSGKITSNGNISVKVRDAAGNVAEQIVYVGNVGRDPKVVEAERREAERVAAEKAAAEKAEAERLAAEKAAQDKAAKEAASKKNSGKTTIDKNSKATSDKNTKTTASTKATKIDEKAVKNAVRKSVKAIVSSTKLREDAGKLIAVKTVSKDSLRELGAGEVIESVKDLENGIDKQSDASTKSEAETLDKAESDKNSAGYVTDGTILKASVGGTAVTAGALLLLLGAFVISQFSYVYILQGGKKRIICKCRVVVGNGKLTAVVPGDKLKGHGKYMLFISPWKKGLKKKVPVSVMLEGEEHSIPTDEGIAFKY